MLSINNVRPDFIVLLVLYWAILYGRFVGVVSGTLIGFVVDLTGTATFFGLSPLIYSITDIYLAVYMALSFKVESIIFFVFLDYNTLFSILSFLSYNIKIVGVK